MSNNQLPVGEKYNWSSACQLLQQRGAAFCIATIVAEAGSLPRGVGAKMVIGEFEQFDTLGGGQLEYEVVKLARAGLQQRHRSASMSCVAIERFALAADLGQCCGGAAQIMFEYINTHTPKLAIFGAGHVAHALVKIIKELPCNMIVIDNRQDWLASIANEGVYTEYHERPADAVANLADTSHLVVMSHDHSVDYQVVLHALERQCFPFIGLIGSASKKQRFEQRLQEQLSTPQLLAQLTCPVGNTDVPGKLPMQVAVSIAAQLISLFATAPHGVVQQTSSASEQWQGVNELRKALKSR